MGFVFLIFQSILDLNFLKVSITYIIIEIASFIISTGDVSRLIFRSVLFLIFSFLTDWFSDSIVKWLIIVASAFWVLA